jgi:hypothetical protein
MATFKVTLHIQDGLTLGHVLMTKGVELIHILEMEGPIKIINIDQNQLTKPNGTKKVRGPSFKHPSGKSSQDFVVEYLRYNPPHGLWKNMSQFVIEQGFSHSSINNAITRLLQKKIIKKVNPGVYALVVSKEKAA